MFYTVEGIKVIVQPDEDAQEAQASQGSEASQGSKEPQEIIKTFPIKFKKNLYMFAFNLKNLYYFDEGMLDEEQDMIIKQYEPTGEELAQLAKEYSDWCDKFKQTPNETLHKLLTDVEVWRQIISTKLELKAASFEANLNKDMFFTSSLGFKSNGDRRTGTNLTNLVAMFDAMGKPTTSYRDYENKNHELNKEQLQTLFAEQVMNGNAIYAQKWEKQQGIAAAKTKADLDKISLDFVMQDFSKKAE